MNFIKKILNLSFDENQKWILIFLFITCLIGAFISPIVVQTLYIALSTKWFAASSLIGSISGLVTGIIWRGKFREFAIKNFIVIVIIECLACFGIGLYMSIFDGNIWIYAITELIYTNLITRIVCKSQMFFKSRLWNDKEREQYDNNESIILYLSAIVGYLIAIIYTPSFSFGMFLFGFCCLSDDMGWLIVYIKNKKQLYNKL